jgi:predicted GNAT family N-acyltransferase
MILLEPFTPHFITPEDTDAWEHYLDLRYTILRKPWGQPKQSTTDEGEARSLHLLIVDADGSALAAGRLEFKDDGNAKIRSMAIREDQQGNGWGRKVIDRLEAAARERGIRSLTLDAREPAVGFYLRLGYRDLGPSYLLFGQIPHRKMKKNLS